MTLIAQKELEFNQLVAKLADWRILFTSLSVTELNSVQITSQDCALGNSLEFVFEFTVYE